MPIDEDSQVKNTEIIKQPTWYKRLNLFDWIIFVLFIVPTPFIVIKTFIEDKSSLGLKEIGIILAIMAGVIPVCSFYIYLFLAVVYSCADKYTPWLGDESVFARFMFWVRTWWFIAPLFFVGLAILTYMYWPIKNMGRLAFLYLVELPIYSTIFGALVGIVLRLFSGKRQSSK